MIYFSVVFCSNVLWISFKLNLQVNSLLHFVWLRILDSPYILSVWISFIIWLVPWGSSSETQRQLGVRMRYVRLREIFGLKSTSRVREPVWKYFYRTSSRSVQSPSRWLARKIFFWPIRGRSCKATPSPSYTKWFFSSIEVHVVPWPVQREDSRGEFQEGDIAVFWAPQLPRKCRKIPQYHAQKILKHYNALIGRVENRFLTATTTL